MPAFKWGWTAPKTFTHRHMGAFVDSDLEHYEILSGHLATTKGCHACAKKAEIARETWRDDILEAFLRAAVWGQPRPHPARTRSAA
jgi:hypothetical protein